MHLGQVCGGFVALGQSLCIFDVGKVRSRFVLWPGSRFLRIVWACTQDLGLFMV